MDASAAVNQQQQQLWLSPVQATVCVGVHLQLSISSSSSLRSSGGCGMVLCVVSALLAEAALV